jgi:mannose-6-phosphate isomerase-like protein (cupin superfamily)
MEINFQNLPEEVVHRMRDGEGNVRKKTFEDDAARIMILTLEPGASIGPHTHDTNFEVFYGVSGRGKVLIGDALDTADPMYPGICHYCPQGSRHSLVNDGDEPLSVFALVAKHIDE